LSTTKPTETADESAEALPARAFHLAYGVYAWIAFTTVALIALAVVVALPGVERRRRATSWFARGVLRVLGIPLTVEGTEHLPATPCVLVANHVSYLDGVVMKAVLPARFAYVVKREMNDVPFAGMLLRRIGTEFVERFDRRAGANDARRLFRNASRGQSLVFFPEGTFSPQRGLLRFHSGAFVAATRANCPLVPALIHGSRAILPGSRALPRPGAVRVELLPPLAPAAAGAERSASELRDATRALMLARLGEPDLAHIDALAPAPAGGERS
jgi:1-acyl-sn-glycerol-3-phosphate acyltransferase